jgi:hypothetical protein
MITKQKCPTCGKLVDVLYTNKKEFDSCINCHPTLKGKSLGQVLHDLNEKRKKESKKTTKKRGGK